jgi:hypothetical protein
MQLEKHTGLGPTKAAKLLGVAYNTYAQYSSGRRVLPLYIERCARLVMLLDKGTLLKVIDLYVHGKKEVDNLVRKGSKDE